MQSTREFKTAHEYLEAAGLNYPIETGTMAVGRLGVDTTGEVVLGGERLQFPQTHKALIRPNGSILSIVGAHTKTLQNYQLADLADAVDGHVVGLKDYRGDGTLLAFDIELGEFGVGTGQDDRVQTRVRLVNSHDNSSALKVYFATWRMVCANGMMGWGADLARSVRHVGDFETKLAHLDRALAYIHTEQARVQQEAASMSTRELTQHEKDEFFFEVHKLYRGHAPSDPAKRERWLKKAKEIQATWQWNLGDQRQNIAGVGGTLWAALNAVTQDAQHAMKQGDLTQDFGRAADLKKAAVRAARGFLAR